MKYQLNRNGSWDVEGDFFSIKGCYPSWNGHPVKPLFVRVEENQILYETEKGSLVLYFSMDKDRIRIDCSLENASGIHDIEPLSEGELCWESVEEPLRCFVQGFGMEGPSGFRKVGETLQVSNGLIAFLNGKKTLCLYAVDHTRFVNRYKVQKKKSLFGLEKTETSAGFCLEECVSRKVKLPPFMIWEPGEKQVSSVLTEIAEKIGAFMGARHVQPAAYHWCSWYYLYQNMSQQTLEEYLGSFPSEAKDFRYIQIDAGYCSSLGDWLCPNHLFPEGMKKAAETICSAGYLPGIWIAPFIVGDQSRLYREHPDWILRDLSGKPVTQIRSYNEPKAWGNPDGNYYILDTSHPDALAYLSEVFRTLKGWGYRLFKTDFMLWNMQDSAKVLRFQKGKTSVEILRDTLKVIREAIGEESYLLGCIAPFLPFIGYADGMRIAGDVGAQWNGAYGPENMLRELSADNYFQDVYWQNDPDSVMLRDFDNYLNAREIRSLALLQALSGGVITTSEPVHLLSEERRKLLAFIRPARKRRPEFPFLDEEREDLVLIHRLKKGNLFFAMNPTEHPLTVFYRFGEFFEEKAWITAGWREQEDGTCWESIPDRKEYFTAVLPPHGSALLVLTQEPLRGEPGNLWDLDA